MTTVGVTVDVGWTRQRYILPAALRHLKLDGVVLSLFKPQYEADRRHVRRGRLAEADFDDVLGATLAELTLKNVRVVRLPKPPGDRNLEAFLVVRP